MMMEDDIIELHRALHEARGLDSRSERYKMHIAKVQDIRDLSEEFNAARTAQLLNLPIETVEMERAHIDRHNQMRRKFLATGDLDLPQLPGTPTVYTIFQK
jgi:hypothetical protein